LLVVGQKKSSKRSCSGATLPNHDERKEAVGDELSGIGRTSKPLPQREIAKHVEVAEKASIIAASQPTLHRTTTKNNRI